MVREIRVNRWYILGIEREMPNESRIQVRECEGGVMERDVCLWVMIVFEKKRDGGDVRGLGKRERFGV